MNTKHRTLCDMTIESEYSYIQPSCPEDCSDSLCSIDTCQNKSWHGWLSLGLRDKYFSSQLCKDHLILAIKNSWAKINYYLHRYREGGFSIWADMAGVKMSLEPKYDPRGDTTQLSDMEFGRIEYERGRIKEDL